MPLRNNEFNPTVSSASCSYALLSNYNKNTALGPTAPAGSVSTAGYIVPSYGAPGYGTLQYEPTCSGYPSISTAYKQKGPNKSNCNQEYVTKNCN